MNPSIFHNLDRKSAEKVRAHYSGFYRYLKGICALRTLNPGDTFDDPYMEVPHEVMEFATEWKDVGREKLVDMTTHNLFPLIANPTDPAQDKTDHYYDGFLLLCRLCRRDGAIRATNINPNYNQGNPGRVILTLPINSILRTLDRTVFEKHHGELVYKETKGDYRKT